MADSIKVICDNLGGPIRVAMGTPLSDVAAQLTPGRYPFLAAFVNNRIKELNYKIYTPVRPLCRKKRLETPQYPDV